jgi:hypothetical protein
VRRSDLPRPSAGFVLEKAEIQGGQFVTGTLGFALGAREKPVHISRHGYLLKLQWLAKKSVIFWDEEDARGWLTNGTSALLHILRANIQHSREQSGSAFLLNPADLEDLENDNSPAAAYKILIEESNRDLTLYVERTETIEEMEPGKPASRRVVKRKTYHSLQDRVEHLYSILEKLIDYQADGERRSGLRLSDANLRLRRRLEGWDFADIAADGDPLLPKAVTFGTSKGNGWTDFTRQLQAVVLFGKGFGDLIVSNDCESHTLPCQRQYLAAMIYDLRNIAKHHGGDGFDEFHDTRHDGELLARKPIRICEKLVWCIDPETFRGSQQRDIALQVTPTGQHQLPVQVLLPYKLGPSFRPPWATRDRQQSQKEKRSTRRDPGSAYQGLLLPEKGAVVFGHSSRWPFHWPDSGDPIPGPQIEADSINIDLLSPKSSAEKRGSASGSSGTPEMTSQSAQPGDSTDDTSLGTGISKESSAVGVPEALQAVTPESSRRESRFLESWRKKGWKFGKG